MDVDQFLRDPVSRRRFFAVSGVGVAAGGSAAFLAACGDDDEGGTEANDVEILNDALALEFTAVAAYEAGAPLLKGEVLQVGKLFLEQEKEHAAGLTTAIEDLGGTPVVAKEMYDFPTLQNQNDVLRFANELENKAVAAYVDAVPKLSTGDLRRTAYTIVANEAEHISVLLGALKQPQVPQAFVTGSAS